MTPTERLAKLLDVAPNPTVEIVVAGERFTARVRSVETFRDGLLDLLISSVSAPAPVEAEPLKCLEIPTPTKP